MAYKKLIFQMYCKLTFWINCGTISLERLEGNGGVMQFENLQEAFYKMKKIHPNLFFKITEAQFEKEMARSKENWDNLDYYGQIYEALRLRALLGDAHLWMRFPNIVDGRFPFSVKKFKEGFCIVNVDLNSISQEILNTQILAINGLLLEEIIEIATPIISTENGAFDFEFEHSLQFEYFYRVLGIADKNEITLTLRDDSKIFDLTVKTMGYNHKTKYAKKSKPLFEFRETNDYAYLKINSFRRSKSLNINKFHNEIMQSASKNKPIIIDVRDNTGGVFGLFKELWEILGTSKATGYCLVNHNSFSSSVLTVQYLRNLGFTIVGEPMAQPASFHGNICDDVMTKSGIVIDVATALWDQNVTRHRKGVPAGFTYDKNAVIPDILIEESLQDLKNNKDSILDYCVNEIKQHAKEQDIEFEETEFCR